MWPKWDSYAFIDVINMNLLRQSELIYWADYFRIPVKIILETSGILSQTLQPFDFVFNRSQIASDTFGRLPNNVMLKVTILMVVF